MFIQEIIYPKKGGAYVINLDAYEPVRTRAYVLNLDANEPIRTHWIALYVHSDNVTYFDTFWVEDILKGIKKFIFA